MIPMADSGARGTLIYEKNLKSKISCQTPFKYNIYRKKFNFLHQVGGASEKFKNLPACHLFMPRYFNCSQRF